MKYTDKFYHDLSLNCTAEVMEFISDQGIELGVESIDDHRFNHTLQRWGGWFVGLVYKNKNVHGSHYLGLIMMSQDELGSICSPWRMMNLLLQCMTSKQIKKGGDAIW